MKNILNKYFFLLLFLLPMFFLLITCKKDRTCYATINVKKQADTSQVVAGATVIIGKNYYVEQTGTTDGAGQFKTSFKNEAILNIEAYLIDGVDTLLYGTGTIKLKPGETVEESVLVN